MATYNFVVSQRPALILAGNQIQNLLDLLDHKTFPIFDDGAEQFQDSARKGMDHTKPKWRATTPANAITPRCNHSTSHVKDASA